MITKIRMQLQVALTNITDPRRGITIKKDIKKGKYSFELEPCLILLGKFLIQQMYSLIFLVIMRIRKEVKRVMERRAITMKKITIIIIRRARKVSMVIRLSMARKEATKSSKNGVTKKVIINNDQPFRLDTLLDLEYIFCCGMFIPVIIAFVFEWPGLA